MGAFIKIITSLIFIENFFILIIFPTPDYADSDRPIGPVSFTICEMSKLAEIAMTTC